MQPIYPYIAVEKTEDKKSSLVQTIEERPVVRIISMPFVPPDKMLDICVEQKILVNHVSEYMVDGEKLYFVRLSDIVSIV